MGKATEVMFSEVFSPGMKINLVTFHPSKEFVKLENTYTVRTGAAQSRKSHSGFPYVDYVSITLIFWYSSITFRDPRYLTGIWHCLKISLNFPVTISVSHKCHSYSEYQQCTLPWGMGNARAFCFITLGSSTNWAVVSESSGQYGGSWSVFPWRPNRSKPGFSI